MQPFSERFYFMFLHFMQRVCLTLLNILIVLPKITFPHQNPEGIFILLGDTPCLPTASTACGTLPIPGGTQIPA